MANAMYYAAAFNLPVVHARTPLGTVTFRHSGETDIVVTISTLVAFDYNEVASSWFWHWFVGTDFATVGTDPLGTVRYRHFATRSLGQTLREVVNTAQSSLGWPSSSFDAPWAEADGSTAVPHYRFTNPTAFTYQFSTAAGAALFGAAGTSLSASSTSHVLTTCVPTFVVFPSSERCSASAELDALDYEPQGVASHVVADDGTGYGNARSCSYFHREWLQQFETPEKAFRPQAAVTHPFTFQHLTEYCRSSIPFYVAHGFGAAPVPQYPVFVLRDGGNFWRPQSASLANHAQIHIPFRTIYHGSLQTPT